MPEMMYLKGRLLGKGKQTSAKTLDVSRYILPEYYFFLGRCSVRGIVLSTMTCCWHWLDVSHIRSGSQQKAPGCFSIKYEGLDRRLQANQCRAAVECQEQEHFMGGSQHLPQGMSLHSCSAWSLQGERGEPWDCRMSAWQGGCFSVGCWHKRALPRENPHREKGKCVSFSPKLCMGQPRAVLLPGDGWGSPRGVEKLCTQLCFPPGHTFIFPCLSSLRAILQPSCIPQGLLMGKPLLEERLWRWGSAEQPWDPPLQLTCSFICCLLLEGSATQCGLRSWNC